MRYIDKQLDDFSCGPIAVINALKSLRRRASFKTHHKIFYRFGLNSETGMSTYRLSQSLRHFKVKYKRLNKPTIKDIEYALNAGDKVILRYRWFSKVDDSGHYVFITGHSKKKLFKL